MSEPSKPKTVAELFKELGLDKVEKAARPDCVGLGAKLTEVLSGVAGAVADPAKRAASEILAAYGAGLRKYGPPNFVQSSLADHARASAGRPMDAGEQMRAAVHDALEARGLELIGPPTITLMTHDEIIAEAPVTNLFSGIDNIKGNHAPWTDHAPDDILADINKISEDIHQATANAMGISRQEAKAFNFGQAHPFGSHIAPIVPLQFEQLPPQNSDLMVATAMHARVGGVVSYSPGSMGYAGLAAEMMHYPAVQHGDQTDHAPALAREYTLGHFHRNAPPQASINCRCYADFRIVIGHADHDTARYEDGEEITRAPWRMPRIRIAGRPIDPRALGWLAVVFDKSPGKKNRHTARRWLRRFRTLVDVASDALAEGNRPRAIEVLSEMIGANEAIDLTTPHVSIRSYWTGSITSKPVEYRASSLPFAQLIGRLKRDHPQIADWEQALADLPPVTVDGEFHQPIDDTQITMNVDSVGVAREGFGVPILRSGVVTLALTQEDYKPAAGEPVFVNTLGQVVPPTHSPGPPIGTLVGPGDAPGTMLVRFGMAASEPVELSGIGNLQPGDGPLLPYAADDARATLELARSIEQTGQPDCRRCFGMGHELAAELHDTEDFCSRCHGTGLEPVE